jgi:hypothetical protein
MIKNNTILETTRTKNILRYLNGLPGFFAVKRHQAGANRKGDPDISGCVSGGRRLELEVKQPSGKLTILQEARLAEWERAGAFTGVVHDVADTETLLKEWGVL